MRDRDDIENAAFTAGKRAFEIALEQRGERLLDLPLWMQRGERFHAIERERTLEIDRLLGPKGAIMVEGRNALGLAHNVGRPLFRHAVDERRDRLLRYGIIPG